MTAQEALQKLKFEERKRKESRRRILASPSRYSASGQDPADVVFFPTDAEGGDGGGCQDATSGGGGFNTFSFLAFLLAGFNAVSLVSNNNNNRNNNNNNRNNNNNNNNFQTLESSVEGMQMVMRKRRETDWNNNTITEVDVYKNKINSHIWKLVDIFMRAWFKNKLTDEKGCHQKHICASNAKAILYIDPQTEEVGVNFAEVATIGLVRELGIFGQNQEEYFEAADLG